MQSSVKFQLHLAQTVKPLTYACMSRMQVNTHMHCLDVSYALLSSYHAIWSVHRTGPPGAQRSQAQLPICAAAEAAEAARLHTSGGVTTRSKAAAARASGGAAGSGSGCSGSSGGPGAGAGGGGGGGGGRSLTGGMASGGGGSGRSSCRSFGVQDGVLHVAGPFLAATEYTEERPAATAAGAMLYTMLLGLVDVLDHPASPVGGSTLARRRSPALPPGPGPPGPNAGPSMSGGGYGRDAGQQGGGGGAAAAGGTEHAGGQEVAGGAGAAASGSRAGRPPASGTWQSAAGEQAQPASLLQLQLRGQLQGAFGVALEPAAEQAQPVSLLQQQQQQQQQPTPLPPRIVAVPETDYPEELQQGYAGVSCPGLVDGEASVLKFLNPDERGIAAFEAERRAYAALAALQGDVLPRLLVASRLADVGPPPPRPRPGDDEEPGAPKRQGWPNGEVRLIATSRVRGVTLREAVVRGGGRITPAVAAAAVRALQRLHAADVVLPGGGHDRADDGGGGRGRFLHGDIRLSNFMLLLPEVMAEAEAEEAPGAEVAEEPRCVVIDLGLSRLDGTEEEQRGEVRQLELRLRGITSGHGQQ